MRSLFCFVRSIIAGVLNGTCESGSCQFAQGTNAVGCSVSKRCCTRKTCLSGRGECLTSANCIAKPGVFESRLILLRFSFVCCHVKSPSGGRPRSSECDIFGSLAQVCLSFRVCLCLFGWVRRLLCLYFIAVLRSSAVDDVFVQSIAWQLSTAR